MYQYIQIFEYTIKIVILSINTTLTDVSTSFNNNTKTLYPSDSVDRDTSLYT
jgi:hypothetical protein